MKIKKLQIKHHPVFNDHTVIFGDANIPSISFLVGNNGSGKTKILEFIYQVFSKPFASEYDFEVSIDIILSEEEKTELGTPDKNIIYWIEKKEGRNNHAVINTSDGGTINLSTATLQNTTKIVFSTVEINFNPPNVATVTSMNIDTVAKPKERSTNLAEEIPQLLVDIKSLDDSEKAKWFDRNQSLGFVEPFPDGVGTRLKRFTDSFHKIYSGEKTFHEIRNISNAKKLIFLNAQGEEISLSELSTGEKQIIYRIGYILKNLGNIKGGIILIDEPEISLHPKWQIGIKDFLLEVFQELDVQIIVVTHSPFIFKNLDDTMEVCIKIDRMQSVSKKISMQFRNLTYSPSVELINYLAFGLLSELLHIELYTLLQIRENKPSISSMESWLRNPIGGNMPIRQSFNKRGSNIDETLMTWIRNRIHHPDESSRPIFNEQELKESIDIMLFTLQV